MSEIASKIMEGFEATHGYPPGDNVVVGADAHAAHEGLSAVGVTGDLLQLYSVVGAVSLPDVGNGFFVHSADDVVDGIRDGQPTTVTGVISDSITVFGSDGGGGLFAHSGSTGVVYRLDGGALVGSKYEAGEGDVHIVAASLDAFLTYLRNEASTASAQIG